MRKEGIWDLRKMELQYWVHKVSRGMNSTFDNEENRD